MKRYKVLKAWAGHDVGAFLDLDPKHAKALVDDGILEETPADTGEGDAVDATVKAAMEELQQGIQLSVRDAVKDFVKAGAGKVDDGTGEGEGAGEGNTPAGKAGVRVTGGTPVRADDLDMAGYKHAGEFFNDVLLVCNSRFTGAMPEGIKALTIQGEKELGIKAAQGVNEAVGAEGGFLIPSQVATTILDKKIPEANLANETDVLNVGGNTWEEPALKENSRASGYRHGGVRGYWLDEASQISKSTPAWTKLKLKLRKLAALVYVTDEMLDDTGIALGQYLSGLAGKEINFLLSDAVINGNGATQPEGILNAASKVTVAKETSQVLKTIVAANIEKMWGRMPAWLRGGAVWYINQDCEQQLAVMQHLIKNVAGAENVGGWPIYMPPGGLSEAPYGRLKGRPVVPIEFCATLGTEGDIILTNLGEYRAIRKAGIKTAMSIHLRFDYEETAFRFSVRFDGTPKWPSALTPYKGTTTLSPVVSLAVRA